jgi:uncharacterized membrane protein HdeD (DUF308 family)
VNHTAGPVVVLVLGLLLAIVGTLMIVNPGDVRGRYSRFGDSLLSRKLGARRVETDQKSYFNRRWYWLVVFLLGCALIISGVATLTS